MILDIELKKANGLILSEVSEYNPSQDAKDVTQMVMENFTVANTIRQKPYREFNDKTLVERQDIDQKEFNSWQESDSEDPDDAWHSNAVRPTVRNKVISIAAHVTQSMIFPKIFAQNENDEEDKDAAEVMRDLMEWRSNEAGYEKTFLYAVLAALVNPATIIHTEFTEVMRTIKEKSETGKITKKEVVDELFSGFQDNIVPVDELYIGDIYQSDIQKQPFLIWRRTLDYMTANSKYKNKENWKHVKPGIQAIFDEDSDGFYEEQDDDLSGRLVEETIYYNRTLDLQLVFVNGILLDDPDEPNPRQDKAYPFVIGGYELIDEGKFFYYKSLAFKLFPDAITINTLYRMTIDGSLMQLMPAMAVFGEEEVDNGVMMPGAVTSFKNKDSRMESIAPPNNLAAGMNALQMLEESVNDSSQSPRQSGQGMAGSTTAFEVAQLEKNAETMLGLFGKMIGFMVKDLGKLFTSDILQYMTVGEVSELTTANDALKFRSFLLPEKNINGQSVTKRIDFDMNLPDEPITAEEEMAKSFAVLKEEGGDIKNDQQIAKVNPALFRRWKYMCIISPDTITPPSDNIQKALAMEAYDRAMNNPYANIENLYKDLLLGSYEATRDDVDKYTKQEQPQVQEGNQPNTPGQPKSPVGAVANAERMAI